MSRMKSSPLDVYRCGAIEKKKRCSNTSKNLRFCKKYKRFLPNLVEENEDGTDEIADWTEEENTFYRWKCHTKRTNFRLCSEYLEKYKYNYR